MATETGRQTEESTATRPVWQSGAIAGVLGAVAFGAMLSAVMTPVIENAIPAMYGLSGGLAGWVIHVSHGAVLGVVFAALAAGRTDSPGQTLLAGALYGVAVWAALAVVVMPVWLQAVGSPGAPELPNVSQQSLLGHVVYGLVVGGVFAALE
jgi:uncharacterized membrane protein YagU involved in acid resistance